MGWCEALMSAGKPRVCLTYARSLTMGMLNFAAALAVAFSPSVCAIRCIAIGAMRTGKSNLLPADRHEAHEMCPNPLKALKLLASLHNTQQKNNL